MCILFCVWIMLGMQICDCGTGSNYFKYEMCLKSKATVHTARATFIAEKKHCFL